MDLSKRQYTEGSEIVFSWKSSSVSRIGLLLSGYGWIGSALPNSGMFKWSIPFHGINYENVTAQIVSEDSGVVVSDTLSGIFIEVDTLLPDRRLTLAYRK